MPPRTKSSGLFTVFQDENTQDAPASSSNRAGSSQSRKEQPSQGKLQPRSKPSAAATSRKALGNKENKPVASSQARASRVFGGKQPFTDASPVKPHSRESAQQPLGALPSCQTKKNTQSQARGFTVLRGGDPVKKSSKSLAVSKLGLANSRMQQHRLNKAALELDQPSAATTLEDQSPVLANISEAFSGQGGFHWSPSAVSPVRSRGPFLNLESQLI